METTAKQRLKFVRWAVVLGIIVVLNIFFVVVRSLVLPEPQFAAGFRRGPRDKNRCRLPRGQLRHVPRGH